MDFKRNRILLLHSSREALVMRKMLLQGPATIPHRASAFLKERLSKLWGGFTKLTELPSGWAVLGLTQLSCHGLGRNFQAQYCFSDVHLFMCRACLGVLLDAEI